MSSECMGGSGESGIAGATRLEESGRDYRPEAARPLQCRVTGPGMARRRNMRDSPARCATRALAAAALALAISPAPAQTYPSRPIHLLLPFAGGTDAVARLLAFKMSPALGEQVLPEQRLGAGGDIPHVPYKSATTALTGLIGGEIDVVIVAASSAASYVKEGRLRALAVLDSKRSSAMPEVPTAAEAGTPLVAVNWYMLLAPAGTPRAIVEKLNAEAVRAMNAADIRERLAGLGGEPTSGSPEDAAAFLRSEYEQWGKVVREAGIKAE